MQILFAITQSKIIIAIFANNEHALIVIKYHLIVIQFAGIQSHQSPSHITGKIAIKSSSHHPISPITYHHQIIIAKSPYIIAKSPSLAIIHCISPNAPTHCQNRIIAITNHRHIADCGWDGDIIRQMPILFAKSYKITIKSIKINLFWLYNSLKTLQNRRKFEINAK